MTVMVWHAQSLIVLTLQGGDLSDALHCNGRTRLEWTSGGRDLALQIALGVSHLHERKVIASDPPSSVSFNLVR